MWLGYCWLHCKLYSTNCVKRKLLLYSSRAQIINRRATKTEYKAHSGGLRFYQLTSIVFWGFMAYLCMSFYLY